MRLKILYYTGWLIGRFLSKVIFRIRVTGRENVPKAGGFILATNHKSYFDPLFLGSWAPRELYYFAKRELWKNKIFGSIITRTNALPVKRGAIDRQAIEDSLNVLKSGYGLVIFPEGTRSLSDDFLEPKPGVGLIAAKARCPVIPAYIKGTNQLKQCFLGSQKLEIRFGRPFEHIWPDKPQKEDYSHFSVKMMSAIGQLRDSSAHVISTY